jgi:hypothetical protein
MKNAVFGTVAVTGLAIVCGLTAQSAPAQGTSRGLGAAGTRSGLAAKTTPAVKSERVAIRDIEGLGARNKVRTPTFTSNMQGATKPPKEWVQIAVFYDTAPDWIDEMTFKFYALALGREEGKTVYSLYENTVTYVDIERGRGHISTMFVRPQAVTRYGELVAIAVEIIEKGEVVAADSVQPKDFGVEWWKKAKDLEGVRIRPGYLLDRSQTPFRFINPDDYEYSRP